MDELNPSAPIPGDALPADAVPGAADAITDEFAFHIEESARRLERQGLAPAAARAEAERRFGDSTTHYTQCRRQAPEARMNRFAKWALAGTLAALATAVCILIVQVRNRDAILRAMNDQMEAAKNKLAIVTQADTTYAGGGPWKPGVVYVDGLVSRAGVYNLPDSGQLTVSRLVTAAVPNDAKHLVVHLLPGSDVESRISAWRTAGHQVINSAKDMGYLILAIRPNETLKFDPILCSNDVLIVTNENLDGHSPAR